MQRQNHKQGKKKNQARLSKKDAMNKVDWEGIRQTQKKMVSKNLQALHKQQPFPGFILISPQLSSIFFFATIFLLLTLMLRLPCANLD